MTTKEHIHTQLLRYGKFIKDIEFEVLGHGNNLPVGCHRIRIISFGGNLYYHHMINGDVYEITLLGRN